MCTLNYTANDYNYRVIWQMSTLNYTANDYNYRVICQMSTLNYTANDYNYRVICQMSTLNYTANDYNYRVICQMSTLTTKSATITPELSRSQRFNLFLLWCRDAHGNENRLHVQKTPKA